MKKIIIILSISFLFLACSNKGYKNVNIEKAIKLVNSSTNLVILDVRTREEYLSGNIPNAINIDVLSQDFKSKIDMLDKNKEYLIYCRSGNRSSIASSIMSTNGFINIYNLENIGYQDFANAMLTNNK
ncbi:rhodanese-like domain-containing protein [Brachyspira pilosicoli]|uniref:Rhodanese domain protein n=1 Tax=Brachyspira pilosicoli (strain ATCC BAA-1826 / 95/1000) TaxID=759914 RepID=D8IAE4_BRAP9|nr:rhodanese-like domain-containing protein [Brachyspira pilosicoli]ADK32274.1 rhodanese domain protein [Brachyspira pilosicoli 95/1000]MBW5382748.1 rhodanese-like domain-containing protein [Brachyspira pilosicoli]MBW5400016.1 rhodanese-like domain-containing protein [Brachyspira pilosicoli]WIH84187.1 rhodanese-like domain-containing protein [Brachyspira pilosicoli]SUW07861.1 rhodanese domain-containing protein [Brachyspira pilosicoli]